MNREISDSLLEGGGVQEEQELGDEDVKEVSGDDEYDEYLKKELESSKLDSEKSKEKQKNKRNKIAGIMFATMGVLVPEHENIQAAEIEPGANWGGGIKTSREDVMNSEVETGSTFVYYKDKNQLWISPEAKQEQTKYATNLGEESEMIEGDLQKGNIERMCNFHSHTLTSIANDKVGWISKEQLARFQDGNFSGSLPSIPPSLTDGGVLGQVAVDTVYSKYDMTGNYFSAVSDPNGVWYYRIATDDDVEEKAPEHYERMSRVQELSDIINSNMESTLSNSSEQELDYFFSLVSSESKNKFNEIKKSYLKLNNEDRQVLLYIEKEGVIKSELYSNNNFFLGSALFDDRTFELYKEFRKSMNSLDFKKNRSDFKKLKRNYAINSIDNEPTENETDELIKGYVKNGMMVRFVPYGQLNQEPPCAGVDYKNQLEN